MDAPDVFYTIVIFSILAAFCLLVIVVRFNKTTRKSRPQCFVSNPATEKQQQNLEAYSFGSLRFENYDLVIDIDKLNNLSKDMVIESTTSGGQYNVNLSRLTCSCPDFAEMRAQSAQNHLSRLCKHLVRAIGENWKDAAAAFIDPVSKLEVRNYIDYKCGAPYEILVKKGLFQKTAFYIVYNKTDWLTVYYPDESQVLKRYGFSITEKRWSYEKNPFPSGLRREASNSIFALSKELIEQIGKLEPLIVKQVNHKEFPNKHNPPPSLVSQIPQTGYGDETSELINFGDPRFFQRHKYIHEISNQFGKSNSNVNALLSITGNPAVYIRYGWTELRRVMIVNRDWQYNYRPPNHKNIEEWLSREWEAIKPATTHIAQTVIGKRRLIAHFSATNRNAINVFINDWPQHSYNPLKDEWNTAYKRISNQDTENWLKQEWQQWQAAINTES